MVEPLVSTSIFGLVGRFSSVCVVDLRSCCRDDQNRILAAAHGEYEQALSAASAAAVELAHCVAAADPSAQGAANAQPCVGALVQRPMPVHGDSPDSTSGAGSAGQAEEPDSSEHPGLQQHSSDGADPGAAVCQAISTASSSEQSQPIADTASIGKHVGSCTSSISQLDSHPYAGLSSAARAAASGSDIPSLHSEPGDSEAEEDFAQLADVLQTCLTARVQAQYQMTSQAVTRCALGSCIETPQDNLLLHNCSRKAICACRIA